MEMITAWLQAHPKAMTWIIMLLAVKIVFSMIVDALLTVRNEIDKTPDTDDTKFEKFVTFMKLVGVFLAKLAANFAGFKGTQSVKTQVGAIVGKKEDVK